LFGNLDEKRIKEIALTQFSYQEMEAYTIQKDFREAFDPLEPFIYEGLPSKISEELAMAS
jgi:hypothetical protein